MAMFLSHTHAFVSAQRDYRLERSNARFLEITTRRLARRRRDDAGGRAGVAPCSAADAAWYVRSA
jgi:hypothetical protein